MDAVREQGAGADEAVALQAVGNGAAVTATGIAHVESVFGDVHVHAAARVTHGLGEAGEALVGEREAGVAADHPARERRLVVVLEGDVLLRARVAALRPVAVRHFVAEHRAQPDRRDGALEAGERPADEGRGRVMVDEAGGPGQGRFGGADEGGEEDHLSSRARSSRHQTRARISRRLLGSAGGPGMPRASALSRCVCALTRPGITIMPSRSRTSSSGCGARPAARSTMRSPPIRRSAAATAGGSSVARVALRSSIG